MFLRKQMYRQLLAVIDAPVACLLLLSFWNVRKIESLERNASFYCIGGEAWQTLNNFLQPIFRLSIVFFVWKSHIVAWTAKILGRVINHRFMNVSLPIMDFDKRCFETFQ